MNSKTSWYKFFCPKCGAELDEQKRDSSGISCHTCDLKCPKCGWEGGDDECTVKEE
jgi:predicted RNA-binding Zn-ribbon protein involved in translation (DUF1610 family)